MSEIGRLRELLAEARSVLSRECFSGECCTTRTRIDEALAEPIVLTQSELDRMLAEAKQQGARECSHHRIDAGVMNRAIREAEGKAFTRGVEEMRRLATREFRCPPYDGCNNGLPHDTCDSCDVADIIDNIPMPSDIARES